MKKDLPVIALIFSLCCSTSFPSYAASCKPSREWTDNITKQHIIQWEHIITKVGFWKSMVVEPIHIWALVIRWGDTNVLNLQLQKIEKSRDRAVFESQFRAAKGDHFFLGMKDGDPLMFTAIEVNNQSKIDRDEGLITTIILSAHISDKDMGLFRNVLTSKPIDAVRILLASGPVERTIDESNGAKMQEQFSCFYQYLDKNGLYHPAVAQNPAAPEVRGNAPTSQDYSTSIPGKWVTKGNNTDYIEYSVDGTFFAQRGGRGFAGTYKVQADTITMQMPNGQATRGRLAGSTITDSDGVVWDKQSEPKKAAGAPLSIEQISQMVASKLPDDVIIKTIQNSGTRIEATPEVLIKLKSVGASDAVIRAISR
jgi:hypothetical protein